MGLLFSDMQVTVQLVHMTCGKCGSHFAIDQEKYDRCKKQGEGWYCPNGHSMVFTKPVNQELKDRISELERSNTYINRAKESLHNQLTHQKKRYQNVQRSGYKNKKTCS